MYLVERYFCDLAVLQALAFIVLEVVNNVYVDVSQLLDCRGGVVK